MEQLDLNTEFLHHSCTDIVFYLTLSTCTCKYVVFKIDWEFNKQTNIML